MMPTYEYRCNKCETTIERLGKMSDSVVLRIEVATCPQGRSVCTFRRIVSAPNFNKRQGQSETIQQGSGQVTQHWDGRQDATVVTDPLEVGTRMRQ